MMSILNDEHKLNQLYRYSLSLTNNESTAYDLVHEAILKSRKRLIFNQEAYLKVSIRNLFFDQYQRNKKEHEIVEESVATSMSFEDQLIDQNEVTHLLKAVSPEEREMLFLFFVEGHTYQEMADSLNINIGTVMSRLSRCKDKIRSFNER